MDGNYSYISGHSDVINDMCLSNDEELLASISSKETIVWNRMKE